MLVVIPFCAKDEHLALLNLELCLKLDKGQVPFDAVLSVDSKTDPAKVLESAQRYFRTVTVQTYSPWGGVPDWPQPQNWAWQATARTMAKQKDCWLWWEADATPLRKGWLETLQGEYDRAGKPFMGCWMNQNGIGYMNGVGIYPARVNLHSKDALLTRQAPFDVVLGPSIRECCHHANDLMVNELMPLSFATKQQVTQTIKSNAVIFHKCKDGSLAHLLMRRKLSAFFKGIKTALDSVNLAVRQSLEPKPDPAPVIPIVRFNFNRVTIYAIWWSDSNDQFNRTIRVLNYCKDHLNAREIVLFCYPDPPIFTEARIVRIPKLSKSSYNLFLNKEVHKHINTEYVMSVHEDGFPYNFNLWDERFLFYDYIGAPWFDNVVGNGGFSITTKKFLETASRVVYPGVSSDLIVCRHLRRQLESLGMRYAPLELAKRFSTETIGNEVQSFGFHGRTGRKYKEAWATLEKWEQSLAIGKITMTPIKLNPVVEIVYILVANNQSYRNQAIQFVHSYRANPPGADHITTIVCNGGGPGELETLFKENLPSCQFLLHDNSGYDIGGFQHASRESKADLMVFFGATTYFNGAGWMKRIIESYLKHGDHLYGTMGNHGDPGVSVNRHIRSTAFWITPQLFNQYPLKVTKLEHRYQFEHKENCLTEWVLKGGLKALVVAWQGEYEWAQWDEIPNGFHRGDQSNLMIGDHISRPPFYPYQK